MKKIVTSWQFLLGIAMIFDSASPLIMKYIYVKTQINLFESYFCYMLGALLFTLLILIYTMKKKGKDIIKKTNKGYLFSGLAGIFIAVAFFMFQYVANLTDVSKISIYLSFITPAAAIICLFICKEKLTWNITLGIIFCVISIYCMT